MSKKVFANGREITAQKSSNQVFGAMPMRADLKRAGVAKSSSGSARNARRPRNALQVALWRVTGPILPPEVRRVCCIFRGRPGGPRMSTRPAPTLPLWLEFLKYFPIFLAATPPTPHGEGACRRARLEDSAP